MVVLGPSPGGWRWQPWCFVKMYVLMALHRWENSFCLAAFIVVTALFFSYMNTTNCSIFSNASCDRFAFSVLTSKKANATVVNAVYVFQGFSFSFPTKEWDRVTISYNVKGRQSSWRLEALAWAAVYLKCVPVPNATHSSSTFISSTTEIASTTTSVSAIRIIIFFCSMKKYSCVHPLIWFRSISVDDETTLSPQVETSILRGTRVLLIFGERKQNRSLLF